MVGNLFIHVPSEIQKLEDFGKGLENYFKTPQEFIDALNHSFKYGDDLWNGRAAQHQQKAERTKDSSVFYTVPCEFYDQQSRPFTAKNLAQCLDNVKQKPFLMVFKYNDQHPTSFDFTGEIRSWYTEHQELRKYMPNDRDAMPNEPNRLLLIKFQDEQTKQTHSFVILKSVLYQRVGNSTCAFALVIFNAERKQF